MGASVNKLVWWLWLVVVVMPSMALGLERRDGAYRCVEEFSRDNTLNQPPFKVNENFVVTLTAPEEQDPQDNHYLVTIAIEGHSSNDCYGVNHKPPFVDDDAVLGCDVLGHTYVFNFDNHRFIEIYKATSYVDGSNNDTPHDTPHVAGGLCTKISQ